MPQSELIPAATIALVRDGADGIEVLLLKRNSKIAYGGVWVFPGGRVDPADVVVGDDRKSARNAAIREVSEEAGLLIESDEMAAWAYWVPPENLVSFTKIARRRFCTWFFLAAASGGDVQIDMNEIHDHEWMRPLDAIARRDAKEIELVAPTWVTLHQISRFQTVADALKHARALIDPPEFFTHPLLGDVVTLTWEGDEDYPSDVPTLPGARHRLDLDPKGWVYQRDPQV